MRFVTTLALASMLGGCGLVASPIRQYAASQPDSISCDDHYIPADPHDPNFGQGVSDAIECIHQWNLTHGIPDPESYQRSFTVYGENGKVVMDGGVYDNGNVEVHQYSQ